MYLNRSTIFTNVLTADRLPTQIRKRPRGFILNVDTSKGPGTHWIAVYLTSDGKGEFFDSYGQRPEFYSANFETFLQDHSTTFTWNEKTLQTQWSFEYVPSCEEELQRFKSIGKV